MSSQNNNIGQRVSRLEQQVQSQNKRDITFAFPPGTSPSNSDSNIHPEKIDATVDAGLTEVDFMSGNVSTPNNSYELNALLKNSSYDNIESLSVYADNRVLLGTEANSNVYRHGTNAKIGQFEEFSISGLRSNQVSFQAFQPTILRFYASTGPNSVNRSSMASDFHRVAYSESTDSINVGVTGTWQPIRYTSEAAAIGGSTSPSSDLYVGALSPQSVEFKNTGSNAIQLYAEGKNTEWSGYTPDSTIGYSDIANWQQSSPQSVSANSSLNDSWSSYDYDFIRFYARVDPSASGTSSTLVSSFSATNV